MDEAAVAVAVDVAAYAVEGAAERTESAIDSTAAVVPAADTQGASLAVGIHSQHAAATDRVHIRSAAPDSGPCDAVGGASVADSMVEAASVARSPLAAVEVVHKQVVAHSTVLDAPSFAVAAASEGSLVALCGQSHVIRVQWCKIGGKRISCGRRLACKTKPNVPKETADSAADWGACDRRF